MYYKEYLQFVQVKLENVLGRRSLLTGLAKQNDVVMTVFGMSAYPVLFTLPYPCDGKAHEGSLSQKGYSVVWVSLP